MKKNSFSESSSDLVELEEGLMVTRDQLTQKQNCNPRHNNNINAVSIETDVWLKGKYVILFIQSQYLAIMIRQYYIYNYIIIINSIIYWKKNMFWNISKLLHLVLLSNLFLKLFVDRSALLFYQSFTMNNDTSRDDFQLFFDW